MDATHGNNKNYLSSSKLGITHSTVSFAVIFLRFDGTASSSESPLPVTPVVTCDSCFDFSNPSSLVFLLLATAIPKLNNIFRNKENLYLNQDVNVADDDLPSNP